MPKLRDAMTGLRAFGSDTRGATAVIFGICSIIICAMMGLSIDLARFVHVRQSLQETLDATVLALAATRQQGGQIGTDLLAAKINGNWQPVYGADVPQVTFDESSSNVVNASASTKIPTTFIRVLGMDVMDVNVKTQSRYGLVLSEVALALDVTASMSGAKLASLQAVAKQMVSDVYAVPGATTKVRFSIVPFGQYVNIGTIYRGQPWLSVPNDGPANVCKMSRNVTAKSGCTMQRFPVYKEGQPTTYADAEVCSSYTYGPEFQVCSSVINTWNGCVGSRLAPDDQKVALSSINPIPGVPNVTCSAPLTRLTNDQTNLSAAIDALTAEGETYLPAGLIWGWRTLSTELPFQDSANGGPRAQRVLVFMTDGENTMSATSPTHDGRNTDDANRVMASICTAIKDRGIELYTIAFDVTDTPTLDRLRTCASSDATFFDAKDSTRLAAAFKKIGDSLTIARLIK